MTYSYEAEKPRLFTEDGIRILLEVRDKAAACLKQSGAVTAGALLCTSGDTWVMLAAVDHLVRLKELREIEQPGRVAGQDRIFVAGSACVRGR